MSIIDYVNIRQGTDSTFYFSTGNTLPLTAVPFGMNHWSVVTEEDLERFFLPSSRSFRGVRLTHQPSPWIHDYASLTLFPQTGPLQTVPLGLTAYYEPEEQTFAPHCLDLSLRRDRTRLRFAPSSRGAVLEIDFAGPGPKRLLIRPGTEKYELPDGHAFERCGERSVAGFVTNHRGRVPADFKFHICLTFDAPLIGLVTQDGVFAVEFAPEVTRLTVRLGSSFISAAQARTALAREIGDSGWAAVAARARSLWETELGKMELSQTSAADNTVFYSCLYRTTLFPREFHEFDQDGRMIHYSPYAGGVFPGPMYTDNGFWDTHRTVYPLFGLLRPDKLGEILEGFLNAAREGGWFPRWCSPGYRNCMTGTHADAVFADAIMKDIGGFDHREAYQYMLKDAWQPGCPDGLYGRGALAAYLDLGYIPADRYPHAASQTMDYAAHDGVIALTAQKLGDAGQAQLLARRAQNYRHLFNPQSGMLQGRHADGSFAFFDPVEWSDAYIEGSSWQCGFAVPHDPHGLIGLLGGPAAMTQKLNQMLTSPPVYHTGCYGGEIHEMVEMAAADFGQYAHSNQPVHHILWFYTLCGRRDLAVMHVHRVARTLYTPMQFPGDEDNGEMSAWYVWAAAGFYPFCPGKPEFVAHRPMFAEVRFHLPGGRVLSVRPAAGGKCALDGESLDPAALPFHRLRGGGVLEL